MEIIEDGRYTWKEVFNELDKDFCVNIRPIVENKDYIEIYNDLKLFKEFIYEIVHKKLYPMRELKGVEEDIRMLIKYVINKLLPYVNNCILELNRIVTNKKREDLAVLFNDYLDLEDDLYALASFRSLYHFAMYMERQDNEADIVWKYIIDDVMGGIFFYSNMMILNDDCPIQNLIKQCPTGYGKCLAPNTMILSSKGYIELKNLNVGDIVYSMKNNTLVKRKILNKWNTIKKQVKIKTRSDIELIVSPEHRLYTQNGYVEAKNLTINDCLYKLSDDSNNFVWTKIDSIEYDDNEIEMIDIEVEDTHNFIANGLVSHNSKSDCDIICFCFGYNINDDIMKCVGNKNNVKSNIENVTQMMKSERYAKVFPYFAQFKKKDDIFEYCTMGEGKFKIKGSSKPVSFFCFNKDTVIDGLRYNKQFYDDVTQSDDINNITNHLKDRDRYERQWKKRKSNTFTCKSWFTGTSYHKEDFISSIIDGFRDDKPLIRDNSYKKYTWGKFVYTNESRNMVYIKVPKLADLELGEDKCYCTFPQKNSKYEALKDYHRSDSSKRTFMAMEQQSPLPPECFGFDYSLLQQYDDLPQEIKSGDCISRAIIDPTRKGRDNYACLIFKKPIDSENKKWYLTDCYYKKVKPNIALPEICKRLSYHKIDEIYFEENILDEFQMKKIISEYMKEEGWEDYKISSIYSTLKKEDKIEKYMYDIRDNIVFPRQGMYYNDSDMGRAMYDISNYSLDGKNEHDDSIDCCAMLCSLDKKVRKNKIEALKFRI